MDGKRYLALWRKGIWRPGRIHSIEEEAPATPRLESLIVLTEHSEKFELYGPAQEFIVSCEPTLLVRQFQVRVEVLAVSPVFVEVKHVWIVFADVKMVVNAAGLASRAGNKAAQKFHQFGALFWFGVQSGGEGAGWGHCTPFDIVDPTRTFQVFSDLFINLSLVSHKVLTVHLRLALRTRARRRLWGGIASG